MSDYWKIPEAVFIVGMVYVLMVIIGRNLRRRQKVRLGPGYNVASICAGLLLANSLTGVLNADSLERVMDGADMDSIANASASISRWVRRALVIVGAFAGAGVLLALVRRYYWELWFQSRHREYAPKFLRQIVAVLTHVAVALILVELVLDVRIPGLLTGSGILVAVVGLAMQDLLGNIIAGAALNLGKPYRIGDWILVDGRHAEVVEVNWRSTRLITNDRHRLDYPNNMLARMPIVNFGARGAVHAMRVTVSVDHAAPPNAVKAAFLRAARHTDGVLDDPPPLVQLRDFGENACVYDIKFFLTEQRRFPEIADALRTHVWYEMHREGMGLSSPRHEVRMVHPERDAPAAERHDAIAGLLLAQPLFSHLHGHEADRLVDGARTVLYGAGEEIVKTGEPGESLFLLVRGAVRVDILREGVRRTVARLREGECFGEMSLLTGEPRGADVFAETDCELLEISKDTFSLVLRERPEILPVLSDLLARRKAAADAAFANLPHDRHEAEMRRRGDELLARITNFFRL